MKGKSKIRDEYADVFVGDYEIKRDDRVLGIWFVYGPENRDWQKWAWKCADGSGYLLVWRFRYYTDDTRQESENVSWGAVRAPSERPEQEIVAKCNAIARMLVEHGFGETIDHVEVYGGPDKAMRLMTKRPWCHMKPETDA